MFCGGGQAPSARGVKNRASIARSRTPLLAVSDAGDKREGLCHPEYSYCMAAGLFEALASHLLTGAAAAVTEQRIGTN